jgi:predicted transcriptional regulator
MKKSRDNDAKLIQYIYDFKRKNNRKPTLVDISNKFSLNEDEAQDYIGDLINSDLAKELDGEFTARQEGIQFFQNHNRTVQEKISSSTETLFTIAILSGTGAQIYISKSSFPDPIIWKSILGGFGLVILVALLLSWDNLLYSLKEKTWNRLERRFKLNPCKW